MSCAVSRRCWMQAPVIEARNPDCASLPRKAPTPLPAIGNSSSTLAGAPLLASVQAPRRTMTHFTLGTAAQACGLNKSTVLRAIKAGKISATRDEHGQWQIDPAEMHRVYPPVASNAAGQWSEQRYAPAQQRD